MGPTNKKLTSFNQSARLRPLLAGVCLAILTLTSCDVSSKLGLNDKVSGKIAAAFVVEDINPSSAKPGSVLVVKGVGFSPELTAFYDSATLPDLEFISSSELRFRVPKVSSGMIKVQFRKGSTIQNFPILVLDASEDPSTSPSFDPMKDNSIAPASTPLPTPDLAPTVKPIETPLPAPTPIPNCTSDGEINCVANANFRAANSTGAEAKIISGKTLAGLNGQFQIPDSGKVLAGTALGTAATPPATLTLPSAADVFNGISFGIDGTNSIGSLTLASPANVRVSQGTFGRGGTNIVPTLLDCSGDGLTGCVATPAFKAANMTAVVPDNIKAAIQIAGVVGTYGGGFSSPCTVDGGVGCLVDGRKFLSAAASAAAPGNIRSGVTIAGVTGTYEGGAAIVFGEPVGEDDVVAPGSPFNLTFNVSKPPGDPSGTLTLYFRSNESSAGCSSDPALAGWTQLVTGLTEANTNWNWASVPWGTHRVCAKFDNGVSRVYALSAGRLFAKDSLIFLTDLNYGIGATTGKFTGMAGADAICASLASVAMLSYPGSFKAVLSAGTSHARDRLYPGAVVRNTAGTEVATNQTFWSELHTAPILFLNTLPDATKVVWTGTGAYGHSTGNHCSSWTSTSGTTFATSGRADFLNQRWVNLYNNTAACSGTYALYCLGDN